MKKNFTLAIRILVSVGILAYLFHSICLDVAREVAGELLRAPETQWQDIAARHDLDPSLARLIRELGSYDERTGVSLEKLSRRQQAQLAWSVGPHEVMVTFRRIDPWWFGAGVACFGMVCLIGTWRWQMILAAQGLTLTFRRALSIFFIGHFFNAFMLGSTGGDVVKAWYVAHETHHKKAEAVATVILDRIIGLLALFAIVLLMMGLYYHRVFDDPKMITFAVVTLSIVAGTVTVTMLGFWKGFADKLPGLRAALQRIPKYDLIRRMVEAYRTIATRPILIWKTMLLSFGVHTFVMLSVACVGYGLLIRTEYGFVDYLLYLPIINTVSAMPVSISGFGVREGMYVAMFGEVGVTKASALALSLLGYLVGLTWSIIGGAFFLTHRKELPPASEMENED